MTSAKKDIVYELVAAIPVGKVATYGQIAKLAGIKNPRHVGKYLHENPDPSRIPCHRVVNAQGRLAPAFAFGGPAKQALLLQREEVECNNGKVPLSKFQWNEKI